MTGSPLFGFDGRMNNSAPKSAAEIAAAEIERTALLVEFEGLSEAVVKEALDNQAKEVRTGNIPPDFDLKLYAALYAKHKDKKNLNVLKGVGGVFIAIFGLGALENQRTDTAVLYGVVMIIVGAILAWQGIVGERRAPKMLREKVAQLSIVAPEAAQTYSQPSDPFDVPPQTGS